MTGAQKLALVAGLGVVGMTGWTLVAGASETPPGSGGQPVQAHPGQQAPRTGAPRTTPSTTPATNPATGHGASGGHGDGHTGGTRHGAPATHGDGHDTGHGSQAGAHDAEHATDVDHGVQAEDAHADSSDTLAPTYFGPTPDADTAIQVLRDGNSRWVSGHPQSPSTDAATRRETALTGQHPFATILTCADSRIPVERVFDRGVGELFVVRVAGNVVAETEAGTIEYGVEHLHTPVVVVMGHTSCGAVKAACEGGEAHGNVRFLIGEITPAVRRAATLHPSAEGAELLSAAVRENVMQSMFDLLATSDSIRSAVDRGDVQLVGAIYDISTGEVEWIGQHPWQDGLISVMNERGPVGGATPRHQATADAETTGGRDGH